MPKQLPDVKLPALADGQEVVVVSSRPLAIVSTNAKQTRRRYRAPGTYVEPPPPPPPPVDPPAGDPWAVTFATRPPAPARTIRGATDLLIENVTVRDTAPNAESFRLEGVRGGLIRGIDLQNVPQGFTLYDCHDVIIEWVRYDNIVGPYMREGRNRANLIQIADGCTNVVLRHAKGRGGDTEDIVSFWHCEACGVEDFAFEGTTWRSGSGSGAMFDGGAKGCWMKRGRMLTPGQVGIGFAGGTGHLVEDVELVGVARPGANIAMYAINYSPGQPYGSHRIVDVRANWKRADGQVNEWYHPDWGGTGAPVHDGSLQAVPVRL